MSNGNVSRERIYTFKMALVKSKSSLHVLTRSDSVATKILGEFCDPSLSADMYTQPYAYTYRFWFAQDSVQKKK